MSKVFFFSFLVLFLFSNCSASLDSQPEATALQLAQGQRVEAEVAYTAAEVKAKVALASLGQAELAFELAKLKVQQEAMKEKEALKKGILSLETPPVAKAESEQVPVLDIEVSSFAPEGVTMVSECPPGWELGFDNDTLEVVLYEDGQEVFRFSEPDGAEFPEYWRLCPGCTEKYLVQPVPEG